VLCSTKQSSGSGTWTIKWTCNREALSLGANVSQTFRSVLFSVDLHCLGRCAMVILPVQSGKLYVCYTGWGVSKGHQGGEGLASLLWIDEAPAPA